jgi:CheY-like chemotaxis protein
MPARKILIVEDDLVTAKALKLWLDAVGYETCKLVASGEDAVDQAAQERPDLVLMDINIVGDIGGIEAAEIIRRRLGIPIVFLTGYLDEDTVEAANAVDHDGYLIKPVDPEELHAVFDRVLSSQADR